MFSLQLKERLTTYLSSRYGVEITDAQAEEFLHSLADLYVALSSTDGATAPRALARGWSAEVDLINA